MLATYIIHAAFEQVRVGGCKQSLLRYPQGQSKTCYQECGCHLIQKLKNTMC